MRENKSAAFGSMPDERMRRRMAEHVRDLQDRSLRSGRLAERREVRKARNGGTLDARGLAAVLAEVYWRLFALENAAVWPAQPLLLAAGALLVLCLLRGWQPSGWWFGPTLGAAWFRVGWQLVALRDGQLGRTNARLGNLCRGALLAALDGRTWHEVEVFAVTPDPTAAATLTLLALAERGRRTALLCVVPVLWLAVSTLTLFTMGAWQGWAVLAALLAGLTVWVATLRIT